MVNSSFSVSINTLSPGLHTLFMRVRNAAGIWSHYEGRMVYISQNNLPANHQVTAAEWFFDTDPGVGQGNPISITAGASITPSIVIPITGIAPGMHEMFIRVKDNRGIWSHYEGRTIRVCSSLVTPGISISANTGTTVCAGTLVNFTAVTGNGGTSPLYQWQINGSNVGTNGPNFSTGTLSPGQQVQCILTSSDSCASPAVVISNVLTMTVNSTPNAPGPITGANSACSGSTQVYSIAPVSGASIYSWTVPAGASIVSGQGSNSITILMGSNSGQVSVTAGNSCGTSAAASKTINLVTTVVPGVIITANPGSSICSGSLVSFNATPIHGGTSPVYQWQLNGNNVGSNSASYSSSTLNQADVVTCIMNSNDACAIINVDTSNFISISIINPPSAPGPITGAGAACSGSRQVYSIAAVSGASSYTWSVPSGAVIVSGQGTTSITILTDSVGGDVSVTANNNCGVSAADSLTINIVTSVIPEVVIIANQGDTICSGATVSFAAIPINGGTTPGYQWQINGSDVGGNNASFSSSNLNDADLITCIMNSNDACASQAVDTSDVITLSVYPSFSPSITISSNSGNTVCTGASVTFLANAADAGVSPVYQWQVDCINAGNNSPTFSSSVLSDGQQVSCVLISSELCANPDTLNSNVISIQVITPPVPQYSIANNNLVSIPLNAQFTNTTPNAAGYDFIWNFGDGSLSLNNAPSVVHTYQNNGVFITGLTAQHLVHGCAASSYDPSNVQNTINCNAPGGSSCGFILGIQPSGVVNGCQGGQITLSGSNIPAGAFLQWFRNGIPLGGAIFPTLTTGLSGFYTLYAADSNACFEVSPPVQVNFNQNPVSPPVISVINNSGNCGSVNATLTASGNFASFLWSNGASGPGITVNTSGNYYVIGQGSVGCDAISQTVNVSTSVINSPEICMITVNESNDHHIVVWEKPIVVGIDSFYIYKEIPYDGGSYQKIASLGFNQLSEFEDTLSDASVGPDRYRLSVLDSCGGESAPSDYVRSMHLQVTPGVGIARVLSWTAYQGQQQNISQYLIYSGVNASSLSLIDSVFAPTGYYIDEVPLNGINTAYRVEARLSSLCESTRIQRDISISNTDVNNLNPSGINTKVGMNPSSVKLFPNPNRGIFEVVTPGAKGDSFVWSLKDISGRACTPNYTSDENKWVVQKDLVPGLYFLEVLHQGVKTVKKFVVE